MMKFANPYYLWLFLIYIPLIVWYVMKQRSADPTMSVSTTSPFANMRNSWKCYLRHLIFVVRLAAIGCLIIILCRPQTYDSWSTSETEGTDIVISLDVSTSMLAQDFKPNRFEAAKDVAAKFVSGRETDNIGLVIFAGESFTQVPLTTDKAVLMNYIQDMKIGVLEDGTAIGDGITTAINRIKNGKAKSKSIILLTDGSNNAGEISPLTAAEIAKSLGIRVYTIGVGTNKVAPYPMPVAGGVQYVNIPVEIDTKTLAGIASKTDGQFYRATNNKELSRIYSDIDKLERSKLNVKKFSKRYEAFMPFAMAALITLLMEIVLRLTWFRRIP